MWKNPKLNDKPNLTLLEGLFTTLPPDAGRAVRAVIALADRAGIPLYLVGGPLRDLLLGHPSLDIDLLVEANAPDLAAEVAAGLGTRPKLHHAFGTATIRGDGWHIDLATARRETYRRPGALPEVTPATVDEDLHRRDFTVNAMALRLSGAAAGAVLNPAGGKEDLDARLIRVLHQRSFQDDATRIFRAARYEARLGFQIEPQTLAWLRRDVSYVGAISGARLHSELSRIFREQWPEHALMRLDGTGALRAIYPALEFGAGEADALAWLRSVHPHGLAAACWPLLLRPDTSPEDAIAVARRIALTNAQTAKLLAMPGLYLFLDSLQSPALCRSEIAGLLEPFPAPALWAFAALHPGVVRERLIDYLHRAHSLKPLLRGDDVIALGVPRGPDVGEVLRRLRAAKLDGEVKTRRDEERLVRGLLAGAPAR